MANTSQPDSTFGFVKARLATGPVLHYAEHGDRTGPALVFLHGWPDSWFSFSRVLPLLPDHYRAIAVDQRGFGESERPQGGYGIADLGADVVALFDAVGIDQATVVGHSFGSFVARSVAEEHPDRVARLVLIGSGVPALNDVTRQVQKDLLTLSDPVPIAFAREFQAGTAFAPLPAPFFDRIVTESLKLPSRLWRETFDRLMAFDDTGELGRIAAPTLLLWGEQDALFSRDDQTRLVNGISDARLTTYGGTGHCPNWECPEQVAADLVAFMKHV